MKSQISNWLLVIGVVVGALAAAGSKKSYRWVELDPLVDLSHEVLYETVEYQRVEGERPRRGRPIRGRREPRHSHPRGPGAQSE